MGVQFFLRKVVAVVAGSRFETAFKQGNEKLDNKMIRKVEVVPFASVQKRYRSPAFEKPDHFRAIGWPTRGRTDAGREGPPDCLRFYAAIC